MHFIFIKFLNYFSAYSSAFSQSCLTLDSLIYFFPPISNLLYKFCIEFLDLKETFLSSSMRVVQKDSVNILRS